MRLENFDFRIWDNEFKIFRNSAVGIYKLFGNTHFAASADDKEDDTIKGIVWNMILEVS